MKNFLKSVVIVMAVIFFTQAAIPTFTDSSLSSLLFTSKAQAAEPPKGLPAGGKGATEAEAIEDMKMGVIKRILGNITSRSEDPNSPYQQLLKRYKEFIASATIDKKSKNANGAFVVTGKVIPRYHEMQAELGKLVQAAHQNDSDARSVYVFVRFNAVTPTGKNEGNIAKAEQAILDRYNVRFRENKFIIKDADEVIGELDKTRSMNFEQFVDFVKQKALENPEISTVVIGEMTMAKESEDEDGVTVSCDINVKALDCYKDFALIDTYEGNEVLRWKDKITLGTMLFEKAAISSAKAIAEKLVVYWQKN